MTARRFGSDWLSFHQRKHGQTRAKSSKACAAAAHKGDSGDKTVEAEGFEAQNFKAQITHPEAQQA